MDKHKLIENVSKYFNINLMSRSRARRFIDARMVCMKVLREAGYTYTDIAELFGMHHTTVMNAVEQMDNVLRIGAPKILVTAYEIFSKDLYTHNMNLIDVGTRGLIQIIENLKKELRDYDRRYNELVEKQERENRSTLT